MYHTVYDITVLPGRDAKTNRHLWSERSQTTAIVLCSYSRSRVSAELLCSSSEPLERFNTPTVGERRWKRTQEWERELTALSLTLEGKLGKTSAGDTSGSVTAALPNADGSSCCPHTWPGPSCAGDVAELWTGCGILVCPGYCDFDTQAAAEQTATSTKFLSQKKRTFSQD